MDIREGVEPAERVPQRYRALDSFSGKHLEQLYNPITVFSSSPSFLLEREEVPPLMLGGKTGRVSKGLRFSGSFDSGSLDTNGCCCGWRSAA